MSDDLIERLREMQENWKAAYLSFASLTFGEAADRIEAQAAEIDRLREALRGCLPYIATQAVGCHGDKCREPWCYSCRSEDDAYAAADKGSAARKEAREALGETK
jgi:hypothetical protein